MGLHIISCSNMVCKSFSHGQRNGIRQ